MTESSNIIVSIFQLVPQWLQIVGIIASFCLASIYLFSNVLSFIVLKAWKLISRKFKSKKTIEFDRFQTAKFSEQQTLLKEIVAELKRDMKTLEERSINASKKTKSIVKDIFRTIKGEPPKKNEKIKMSIHQ